MNAVEKINGRTSPRKSKGHVDVAKVLLENSADVNAVELEDAGQQFTLQLERIYFRC